MTTRVRCLCEEVFVRDDYFFDAQMIESAHVNNEVVWSECLCAVGDSRL